VNSIEFQSEAYENLRRGLLADAPREAAAILLAGCSTTNNGHRVFVRDLINVPADAYSVQSADQLEIYPSFLAPILKRARGDGTSLVFAHTHPFGGRVRFSHADDLGESVLMPTIFGRAPNRLHGALVIGPEGFDARLRQSSENELSVERIREIGRNIKVQLRDSTSGSAQPEFDRSVRAFGVVGQNALRQLCVAIVGLGGTGSIVAEQFAHLGVGRIILMDNDVLEETNLNRVVGATRGDIGRRKVDIAAAHVARIRSNSVVKAVFGSVLQSAKAKPLLEADLIMCCTDSHGSRAVINQIAYQYFIPTIDMGVRIDASNGRVTSITGRVQMLGPGLPCLQCHNFLDSEAVRRDLLSPEERVRDPYIVGEHEPQPAVISLNGTVASLAVSMALAAITGLSINARHQIYRADQGAVREVESKPVANCIVCSQQGALGRGDSWPLPWRTA